MDTTVVATLPPNTIGLNALLFMGGAWLFVLSLMTWSYTKLLAAPKDETPPPGSAP